MNTSVYKEKLLEEKGVLLEELKALGRVVHTETGDWEAIPEAGLPEADENDLADRAEDFQERTSILQTLEARYADVNVALDKIEGGNYGTCEVSGEPIEEDRLMANPAARTCKAHMNN